jgi:hypothetical protein
MQGALGGILCSGVAPHLLAVCALRAERLLQVVGETVDCALDGVHERRTECKFAPHQRVLDDGASELAAFAGVVASEVPCLFSNAQRRRADFEPPQIQRIQCDIRARAFLAQPIRSGHGNPFEHHAAGGRAVQPQFMFLALHEQARAARSTRNAVKRSPSTFAKVTNRSAKPAFVIQILLPVIR